ncbi:transcriptional adapter 2-alpha-like [Ruditapes philippinarum]|uniref:transcriptional adapter 2-alpha-like n=1 Tax=Ruditapes philippinarum TaxID=129788 RepID=UPI00295BE99E|nr:transcriptional adapter 2-alpha-like [Ruditapes philippinarum]
MDVLEESEPCCFYCTSLLMEPYIQCASCEKSESKGAVTLCLHCFAKGVEFGDHQSDHPYTIVKNNFPVFERNWTALEEMQLLKAVCDCGYGNWLDIAHKVRTKTYLECERHYNQCYIEKVQDGLPEFPESNLSFFPRPVVFKLSEDPPRPAEGSHVTTEMAGYMAGRGDFMVEHENYFEHDLRNLHFDFHEDDQVETDLKFAVVDVYMRCLKERRRRKRIIRKYGLINLRKNMRSMYRHDVIWSQYVEGFRVFARLLSPDSYEMFQEALYYEQELKNEIRHLKEYRSNGLTKLQHIKMFRLLKKNREKERGDRHLLQDVISHIRDESACQTWLQRQAALESLGKPSHLPSAPRRVAPPLDVTGLPSYDRLNVRERELCSQLRLMPSAYLEFKVALINESDKHGGLRLAQARQLIKIDVNKTRKIYDLLVNEGSIKKDSS